MIIFRQYPYESERSLKKERRTITSQVEVNMSVTSRSAETIVHAVLSMYEEVQGVSLVNMKGNILASNSKEVFRDISLA